MHPPTRTLLVVHSLMTPGYPNHHHHPTTITILLLIPVIIISLVAHSRSIQFYEGLANRAAQNRHVVDIYSCSLNQTGLHEMRYLPTYTGGHMVMGDNFTSNLFKDTYRRAFDTENGNILPMGFAAQMEVKVS